MKVEIQSTSKILKYHLKNLWDKKINFKLGEDIKLVEGWYELNIEYTGQKTEIKNIILNGYDIKHLMYTGYYIDGAGRRHQPACALWDEGGCFKIWLHTSIGVFIERLNRCIRNGDFGKDLSEKYVFTCDKPKALELFFPDHIRSFFETAKGPYWWRKDSESLPYRIAPLPSVDKQSVLEECMRLCVYQRDDKGKNDPGYYKVMSTDESTLFDLPFITVEESLFPHITKLLKEIKMKRVMSIGVNFLEPGHYIDIHNDDHDAEREASRYLKGCNIFYWQLTDTKEVYYKFSRSGLLPIDSPLFINPIDHVHSVVNQSNKTRIIVNIAGEYHNSKYE